MSPKAQNIDGECSAITESERRSLRAAPRRAARTSVAGIAPRPPGQDLRARRGRSEAGVGRGDLSGTSIEARTARIRVSLAPSPWARIGFVFRHTAHVYDLLYESAGKDYEAEADALHTLIQQRAPGAAALLDVACGTGGHLVHLQRWYDVAGVDIDPGMLDEARRRLPGVTLVQGDMRTFRVDGTCDAVTCLFSSVGYLRSERDLHEAVSTMASHLRPGGVFVMDGWIRPEAWTADAPIHLQTACDETLTVARMSRSRREGNKTFLDMHHLIGSAEGIEHVVDTHELTLFESGQYEESMHRAGLVDIETVESPMPGRDRFVGVTTTH